MAVLSSDAKNKALSSMADALRKHAGSIIEANKRDIAAAGDGPMSDRLMLNEERIENMAKEVENVAALDDYVGRIIDEHTRDDGLSLQRVRVPLGVVGMIYESRPNVTSDASALCLKSGNAVILKGGSDAINSNRAIAEVIRNALSATSVPLDAIGFVDSADRAVTAELLTLKGDIDVIIPRGGSGLIDFVAATSRIPVIETGASVVHTYVDADADIEKALKIVVNAKTRRVSICNALDTILVHKNIAEDFLRWLAPLLAEKNTEMRCDARAMCILKCKKCGHGPDEACTINPDAPKNVRIATDDDFGKEFLDYILAVKVVDSTDEAIEHVAKYSLKHSEAIVTENRDTAEDFLKRVDSACCYWNASTQFSDGAQFGLGAEIGISTQKLHARGPFALEGLTTYKWIIRGNGHIRQ